MQIKERDFDGGITYNQEHVWPQSKCIGTSSTDIGDIMHLRPANRSENSSRNNTAYGESEEYYDPGVSVRGDCARTLLYLYVRWGNTGNMWGVDGVIESLDILLRWIKEDPVDTWEMGHNDAVQSITGVRNVFVDYPESAWLLFGSEIPADLETPSDSEKPSGYSAQLVTDADSLKIGDRLIIAALDYDYAMSTEQKTSNRGQTTITTQNSISPADHSPITDIATGLTARGNSFSGSGISPRRGDSRIARQMRYMIVYVTNNIVGRRHASAVAESENAGILADSRRRGHALALQS